MEHSTETALPSPEAQGSDFRRKFFVLVYVLWLILLVLSLWDLSRKVLDLKAASDEIESYGAHIKRQHDEIKNYIQHSDVHAKEIAFLQSLSEMLPKDKGYVRTKKIIP